MSDDIKDAGGDIAPTRFSLSRWSERKRAIARGEAVADAPPVAKADAAAAAVGAPAGAPAAPAPPLPHVDSLTFDSDFTVFMTGDVDATVKRAALRTLLHDPRFNVMDGLDVYIDDYSIPDPISPEILAQLRHSIAVLNPVFPADDHAPQLAHDGVAVSASEGRAIAADDRRDVEANHRQLSAANEERVAAAPGGIESGAAPADAATPAGAAAPFASAGRREHDADTP